jgi:hypothetical protein
MPRIDETRPKRQPDFEVTMTFLTAEEGGRKMRPFQGYRSDVAFPGDNALHMIHPTFLNEDGSLYAPGIPAPPVVRADMYIVYPETRPAYREKVRLGTALRIVEGSFTVANAVVTAVKNLPNDDINGDWG